MVLARHRGERVKSVPPGGNRSGGSIQRLQEEGDDQFRENPPLGGPSVLMRKTAEFQELLVALERQLDLPAKSIQLQHVRRREQRRGQGRKDHHKVRGFQGPGITRVAAREIANLPDGDIVPAASACAGQVATESYRQLLGWVFHPLVLCAFAWRTEQCRLSQEFAAHQVTPTPCVWTNHRDRA